ncbi:hypothetical protein BDV95DRAFT_623671 [Massariosphaeria phaeospora]|uniref:F-box domain-containing protein n=1 Tax=Massariosphaeria phaeospora TaxID=100035 RepID=A0A7C8M2F6_9PLEO|nr:hypothetical protein BDV95DRAFT_623671 [Massariosphaeria phaeospora]
MSELCPPALSRATSLPNLPSELNHIARRATSLPNLPSELNHIARGATLPTLPSELIARIASSLDSRTDILSLRLTCGRIYTETKPAFWDAYLRVVHTSLCKEEITDLQELATHAELRKYVRKLCVCSTERTYKAYPQTILHHFGHGYVWNRNPDGALAAPVPMVDILSDLLEESFKNCREFRVENIVYQPHYRQRHQGDSDSDSYITPSDAVFVVLSAITKAQTEVQSFEIDLGESDPVTLEPIRLSPNLLITPIFKNLWGLNTARLSLVYEEEPLDILDFSLNLILDAHKLQVLQLDFSYGDARKMLDRLNSTTCLPPLETLILKQAIPNPESIKTLIQKVGQKLQTLSFYEIGLTTHSDMDTWKAILTSTISHAPYLKSFAINHVDQNYKPVLFCPLRDNPDAGFELLDILWDHKCRVGGVCYRGADMQQALNTISSCLYVFDSVNSPGWPGKDFETLGFVTEFKPSDFSL